MKKAIHIKVTGHVQGVGYRWFVLEKARELNLTGWVCNNLDFSVDILSEGEENDILDLISNVKEGPRSAEVENVEVIWSDYTGDHNSFDIGYH